jgi:hypothetical protein
MAGIRSSNEEDCVIEFIPKGDKGDGGTSGTNGAVGTSGTNGAAGTSGTSGDTGSSGTSGDTGSSGTSGDTGSSGTNGAAGTSGQNGINGDKGGLKYEFNSSTSPSGMTKGYFRYNNGNASLVGEIYIHDQEWYEVDVSGYLLSWDNSTSTVKGHIIIKSNNIDDETFVIYQLNDLSDGDDYVQFNVTYVAGTGPTNGEACVIEFIPKGDGGSGTSGTSGIDGDPGTSGTSGVDGDPGTSGTSGANGNPGSSGTSGTRGTSGVNGTVTSTSVATAIWNGSAGFPDCPTAGNCSPGDYIRYCPEATSNGFNGMCFGA